MIKIITGFTFNLKTGPVPVPLITFVCEVDVGEVDLSRAVEWDHRCVSLERRSKREMENVRRRALTQERTYAECVVDGVVVSGVRDESLTLGD